MPSLSRLTRQTTKIASALLVGLTIVSSASAQTGVNTTHIDRTIDPCTDLYMFSNGAWYNATEIPADRATWGAWGELYERNLNDQKSVLDAAAASGGAYGTPAQKVGDFFKTAMDSAAIEALGYSPLKDELARITAIKSATDLIDEFVRLQKMSIYVPFALEVYQDAKNSTRNIIQFSQDDIGLPDRDYYINEDEESKELRAKYVQHITNMIKLLGDSESDAAKSAQSVMALETRLAKASMTQVQRRDPDSTYNITTIDKLKSDAGGFDWNRYFAKMNIQNPGDINDNQPLFTKEVAAMMSSTPLDDWRAYLRWHLVKETAPYLSSAFVNEDFSFDGVILSGRKELRPRWKRVMAVTDYCLGEMLGKLYVEKHFSPEAKKHAEQLVINLKAALRDRLAAIDWISEPTRQKAFEKLAAIKYKIGYPDKWRDYSKLEIKTDSYVENVLNCSQFEFQRNLDKLGKPVDRDEWYMTASTVNAYYASSLNEIVFPAGILQPPFFDVNADDALNYGGIGMVIGHELTHGFDDEGRKYDADGNLKEWWTADDAANFEQRADLIRKQYSEYVALDTFHVNGDLTSGENIADLGGLKIAYYAYQKSLEGKPRPIAIDGFTPEQRFFINFAHCWRSKIRDEAQKMYLATDPHSPDKIRVNGTVSNLPEFAEAFGCKPDDPGIRPVSIRVKIW